MSDAVLVPGGRDVRGTLDAADDAGALVVACPPHPKYGGSRGDRRLVAVADALTAAGVDCLRFDYGPWDGGRGERTDARSALEWGRERHDRVGLFGYSFGAAVALLVASETPVDALSALAPPARLGGPDGDAVAPAVSAVAAPAQVVYGARDDTVDWAPVVEAAEAAGWATAELPADHHFVGQDGRVAEVVASFLTRALR
ncbi:MAG: alpha/beta hydrolase [Haloferacaceae archaeon]